MPSITLTHCATSPPTASQAHHRHQCSSIIQATAGDAWISPPSSISALLPSSLRTAAVLSLLRHLQRHCSLAKPEFPDIAMTVRPTRRTVYILELGLHYDTFRTCPSPQQSCLHLPAIPSEQHMLYKNPLTTIKLPQSYAAHHSNTAFHSRSCLVYNLPVPMNRFEIPCCN